MLLERNRRQQKQRTNKTCTIKNENEKLIHIPVLILFVAQSIKDNFFLQDFLSEI